ncbi:hypothetical protein [Rubrivivax gelatinosus]|uniref:hypothetical protein n=1 Tax=Rubrivivax gelatinosus TaxID=28068 RepID=UPI0005C1977F|nr:hypothetical protein [Rubrivivax gelatinosus]MBG6083076.1 hypothetical protein [Rubrivivax gelatinosus]
MNKLIAPGVMIGIYALILILGAIVKQSPDGTISKGVKAVLGRLFVWLSLATSNIVVLEVLKNVSQAMLFSGPTVFALLKWEVAVDGATALWAMAVGLVLSLAVLIFTTARLETLR